MEKLKIVFTGGGTGGHVYPNIAIYETIREKYPNSSFLYIGNKKGAEKRIVKNISQPIQFISVLSKGIPQKIKSFKTIISVLYILMGTIKSIFLLKKFKPDIIVGSGGYVSAPVLFAASFLKIKVFIHEQNAVPGRFNRFIARFANKIGVSFSSTTHFFPTDKVVVTGYPLRKAIRYNKEENIKKKYKIPEKNKVVFIFGGSGGARTINNALAEIIPALLAIDDLTVILSTGRGYSKEYKAFDDTVEKLQEIGIPSDVEGKLITREYFDNIDEIYAITDLVVSRAGAGTIKEITTIGLPSILIPKIDLPGDHQILNAKEIEKIGGAKIVFETVSYKYNKRTIYLPEIALYRTIINTLFDSDQLFNMRKNLKQVEKQNSTEIILKEMELLLKSKEKAEDSQIKVSYLQPQDDENNIELIFDSTIIGNSYLSDITIDLGEIEETTLAEIKLIKNKESNQERIVVRKIKGEILLDDQPVDKWTEIKENSKLQFSNKVYTLKSYSEKVIKVQITKSTTANILGSSFGILFSRFGGLFRNIFIAAKFGASKVTDMFFIGLTIANLLRRIVAENALENAFLPIFSRIFHRSSRKKTWEAASSIINFTLLVSVVMTTLLIIFTPFLIKIFFPKLVEKGMLEGTINMTRLILPFLLLITLAAVLMVYLKAFNRFGIAESSTIFFSIGVIAGVLLFYNSAGAYSLAYGVLLGGFLQILFLFPFIIKIFRIPALEFSYQPRIHFTNTINKKYYRLLIPISLDVIFSKFAEVVGKFLAHRLSEAAISFLHYSLIIFQLPFAIISQAINSVILKEFSEQIALFDKKKARQLFLDGIKTNIFLLTPLSVLMIALAEPIVSVLLERSSFNHQMMMNTAYALKFYSIGLVGWGIHSLTVRVFSARLDINTSLILNVFMLLTNIGLSLWLVHTQLTFAGLALATSISFLIFALIRILVLKIKLEKEEIFIKRKDILSSTAKTLFATIVMLIVLAQSKYIFSNLKFKSTLVGNVFSLISLSFIGISVYLLTSLLLKNTELLFFKSKIRHSNNKIPISMLSPFKFFEIVSKNSEFYKDDYFYKINIYTSSKNWEIRNIGIKLIGLFKDADKISYLVNVLKSKKENGFIRRNAIASLTQLNAWNPEIKNLIFKLLQDSYYEVRSHAMLHLAKCGNVNDYNENKHSLLQRLSKSQLSLEEQLALFKIIAKFGVKEEIKYFQHLYLSSNSLLREEILELLYNFYRRKILNSEELKENVAKILITSNHLNPEFKLKSIIKKIYKEIEKK